MESSPGIAVSQSDARFQQLYSHRSRLYRGVTLTVGNPSVAAEAIDEAMARAYRRWGRLEHYDSPEGWVYRVALNLALSTLRNRRREDLWEHPPERGIEDSVADPDLRSAIAALPTKYRSTVVARYLLDWSTEETAKALGIPESTVKTRLRRALIRLQKDLKKGTEE